MKEEDVSLRVLRLALEDPARGVPCLIGPTQYGKSHEVRRIMAEMGKDVVIINPQNDLPEDIAGWPSREGDKLYFTQPSIIPPDVLAKDNFAIMIDELDKARDDTTSSLLTLLDPSEKRLRFTKFSDNIPIACLMNEPERELPDPLIARLLFIAYPGPGYQYNKELKSLGVSELLSPPKVNFPTRAKAPGSFWKLKAWIQCPEFWEDKEVRAVVVRGLFPSELVPGVMEKLQEEVITASFSQWAKVCSPLQLAKQYYMLNHGATLEETSAALTELKKRSDNDTGGELAAVVKAIFTKKYSKYLAAVNRDYEKCKENGALFLKDLIDDNILSTSQNTKRRRRKAQKKEETES